MGLPPHLDQNDDNKATVLPTVGARRGREAAMKPLPPVDHTIRIPPRLIIKCWRAIFMCSLVAGVAFMDARDPDFRAQLGRGVDAVLYRLSLDNVQRHVADFYSVLVNWGVNVILPAEDGTTE